MMRPGVPRWQSHLRRGYRLERRHLPVVMMRRLYLDASSGDVCNQPPDIPMTKRTRLFLAQPRTSQRWINLRHVTVPPIASQPLYMITTSGLSIPPEKFRDSEFCFYRNLSLFLEDACKMAGLKAHSPESAPRPQEHRRPMTFTESGWAFARKPAGERRRKPRRSDTSLSSRAPSGDRAISASARATAPQLPHNDSTKQGTTGVEGTKAVNVNGGQEVSQQRSRHGRLCGEANSDRCCARPRGGEPWHVAARTDGSRGRPTRGPRTPSARCRQRLRPGRGEGRSSWGTRL